MLSPSADVNWPAPLRVRCWISRGWSAWCQQAVALPGLDTHSAIYFLYSLLLCCVPCSRQALLIDRPLPASGFSCCLCCPGSDAAVLLRPSTFRTKRKISFVPPLLSLEFTYKWKKMAKICLRFIFLWRRERLWDINLKLVILIILTYLTFTDTCISSCEVHYFTVDSYFSYLGFFSRI